MFKEIFIVIESSQFLSSFWSNLFAGLVIAGLFSIIFPRYLEWLKKPKLYFITNEGGSIFKLSKSEDGKLEGTLQLSILNKSKVILRNYYWHLYMPDVLNPQPGIGDRPVVKKTGEFIHWYGSIESPLFPGRAFLFPYELKLKTELPGSWNIYYFFSTEYGLFPSRLSSQKDVKVLADSRNFETIKILAE